MHCYFYQLLFFLIKKMYINLIFHVYMHIYVQCRRKKYSNFSFKSTYLKERKFQFPQQLNFPKKVLYFFLQCYIPEKRHERNICIKNKNTFSSNAVRKFYYSMLCDWCQFNFLLNSASEFRKIKYKLYQLYKKRTFTNFGLKHFLILKNQIL